LIVMSVVQKCMVLALAHSALAANSDHASNWNAMYSTSEKRGDEGYYGYNNSTDTYYSYDNATDSYYSYSDGDAASYGYYDYTYGEYTDYDYYSEPTVGENIRDALSDAFESAMERYGDEEALNNWFEETGEAAEEMDARHNAE